MTALDRKAYKGIDAYLEIAEMSVKAESNEVCFLLDGQVERVVPRDPTRTLLEWLREERGSTGSKEGCAEGDCGACTVLVGELGPEDRLVWRAVNSCILFLPMLDGKALKTVESLSLDGKLHPVQQAMASLHGSQCGFCTPGIVMSLYGRTVGAAGTEDLDPADLLAGNLCRCTGYGPILEAARQNPPAPAEDGDLVRQLKALRRQTSLSLTQDDPLGGQRRRWFSPRTADELAKLLVTHPDARIVAGATDVGLWVTKQHRVLTDVIFIGGIADLAKCEESPAGLTLGAALRYNDAQAALARLHPDLGELVRRIGALQVRNAGTIGGNIANGSPIGDMPPALIALGAELTLRYGEHRRRIKLEDFFVDYGKQDRRPGEFVESIIVPRPKPGQLVRIVKLSKRFDSDITAVLGAFSLTLEGGKVTDARIAFGGMAGTPKRAAAAEAALRGKVWSAEAAEQAVLALTQDFAPMSDQRGSSAYRLTAAGNLLRRLWHESAGSGGTVLDLEAIDA